MQADRWSYTLFDVVVPSLGESITEATIGGWLKAPGDLLAADEPLLTLETDKVSVEVLAPAAGILGSLRVQEGDTVEVGDLLTAISPAVTAVPDHAKAPSHSRAKNLNPPEMRRDELQVEAGKAKAAPSRQQRQNKLPDSVLIKAPNNGAASTSHINNDLASLGKLGSVAGSGTSHTSARGEKRVPLSPFRKAAALELKTAQNTAAILTTFNDVDMTAVLQVRERYSQAFKDKYGIESDWTGFFVKAACAALKQVPLINAFLTNDEIVYHADIHLSILIATESGSVSPIIRNADTMTVGEIQQCISNFVDRANNGAIDLAETYGGTFTISDNGPSGSLLSVPIPNHPQSAILCLHRVEERPVVFRNEVVVRPMMNVALSYDHRMIDGREAVTFLKLVKMAIEEPLRLLLEL